jgi:hypothetical protein
VAKFVRDPCKVTSDVLGRVPLRILSLLFVVSVEGRDDVLVNDVAVLVALLRSFEPLKLLLLRRLKSS